MRNRVTCKFQGADLLASKPEYFKWEHSCFYLKMFLLTFKCKLLYSGQSLCQVSGTFDEQASILGKLDQKNDVKHSVFLFSLCKMNI